MPNAWRPMNSAERAVTGCTFTRGRNGASFSSISYPYARDGAFKPERWLAESSPAKAAASARRVAMPFGAGPRLCPGRYLAMLEIKMVMAMLLAGFDVEQVSTPDGKPARERFAFTMSPVGLRAKLRMRQ